MYALLLNDQVSAAVKLLIISALGYFICPVDVIPDFLPVVGFSNDLSVIVALLTQLEVFSSREVEAEILSKCAGYMRKNSYLTNSC